MARAAFEKNFPTENSSLKATALHGTRFGHLIGLTIPISKLT